MTTKRKELSDLQRDLLQLAVQGPKAKIWLPKASQQSFPTTYAAIVSLQRRGLLDPEQAKDPEILSWKVTKEGREAAKLPKAEPTAPKPTQPAVAPASKAPAAAPAPRRSAEPAPARDRGGKGKEAVATAKPDQSSRERASAPALSSRAAPVAPEKAARERGAKGKTAVPAASPTRSAGKKAAVAAPTSSKKSGGRGRT